MSACDGKKRVSPVPGEPRSASRAGQSYPRLFLRLMTRKTTGQAIERPRVQHRHGVTPRRWPELFEGRVWMMSAVREAIAAGRLRPLGLGLYTSNLVDDPADIIERHAVNELEALRHRIDGMRRRRVERRPA